jgi:predicted transcriptional regulator of viral defense system
MTKLQQITHDDATITRSRLRDLGVFRSTQAEALGFSRWTLARLAERGDLVRVERGIYHHRDADVDPATLGYVAACLRVGPDALIGGLTSLFHYVLIEQIPTQVWVILPTTNRGKFPQYRLLHTKHDPTVGVTEQGGFRMATVERSIVEAFAYATKIGLSIAITAGRTALREGKATEKSLWETAEALGRVGVIRNNWEALTIL